MCSHGASCLDSEQDDQRDAERHEQQRNAGSRFCADRFSAEEHLGRTLTAHAQEKDDECRQEDAVEQGDTGDIPEAQSVTILRTEPQRSERRTQCNLCRVIGAEKNLNEGNRALYRSGRRRRHRKMRFGVVCPRRGRVHADSSVPQPAVVAWTYLGRRSRSMRVARESSVAFRA